MTISRQLQALFLCPGLDATKPSLQPHTPEPRTQLHPLLGDQDVEQPHIDVVKQLGEQLYSEGGIDATPSEEIHGRRQGIQYVDHGGFVPVEATSIICKVKEMSNLHIF